MVSLNPVENAFACAAAFIASIFSDLFCYHDIDLILYLFEQ